MSPRTKTRRFALYGRDPEVGGPLCFAETLADALAWVRKGGYAIDRETGREVTA